MDTLISLRLPSELVERLDDLAKVDRRSRSFLVRDAIESFLPAPTKKKPAAKAKRFADSGLTPKRRGVAESPEVATPVRGGERTAPTQKNGEGK